MFCVSAAASLLGLGRETNAISYGHETGDAVLRQLALVVSAMIRRADHPMYAAKRSGRNRVEAS